MTKKKQVNKTPFLRYALSFSAFLLVFWTVSCNKDLPAEEQEKMTQQLLTEKLTANKSPKELDKETLSVAEKMPRFPGCEQNAGDEKSKQACSNQKLLTFIYDNIEYPKKAKEDGTEGMAVVRFVVTKEGTIEDLAIMRSVSPACDAEVIRVMELMNAQGLVWTPGEQDGKLVNVTYNLPVRFKLQ